MKNDFRGKIKTLSEEKPVTISVPPTLLMTAVGKVPEVRLARTSDFKRAGDWIYLLGGMDLGLRGSEFAAANPGQPHLSRIAKPDWPKARSIYSWLGGAHGKEQGRVRSAHDISEGGLLVALAECLIARGLGAQVSFPSDRDPWEFGFGEGFHTFVISVPDSDGSVLEADWNTHGVPFLKLGMVNSSDRLEVLSGQGRWSVPVKRLRVAWQKGGYWE